MMEIRTMCGTFGAYALIITGFLACPCHLPLVLPLALTLLAGTPLGGLLAHHIGLIYSLSAAYFVVALLAGLRLSGSNGRTWHAAGRAQRHVR